MRRLGLRGLEMTEIYDIEPWAIEHLSPRGLIFCFPCEDEQEEKRASGLSNDIDYSDPVVENVWYAHQLSSDTCASQAILNVVLNLDDVNMSDDLRLFANNTSKMNPIVSCNVSGGSVQ